MEALLVFIQSLAGTALVSIMVILTLRSILSIFLTPEDNSPLFNVIYNIAEIFISPMRAICDRFDIGTNSPIDIPAFITVLIVCFAYMLV